MQPMGSKGTDRRLDREQLTGNTPPTCCLGWQCSVKVKSLRCPTFQSAILSNNRRLELSRGVGPRHATLIVFQVVERVLQRAQMNPMIQFLAPRPIHLGQVASHACLQPTRFYHEITMKVFENTRKAAGHMLL